MTHGKKSKTVSPGLKSLVQEDRDLMKELAREALQTHIQQFSLKAGGDF